MQQVVNNLKGCVYSCSSIIKSSIFHTKFFFKLIQNNFFQNNKHFDYMSMFFFSSAVLLSVII